MAAGHLIHYVVVRTDLPVGIFAAMLVHAAGESSPGGLPTDTHAVVLAARNESDIERIALFLESRGVRLHRIVEDQPPYEGQLMALGLAPGRKEDLRRHLSALPLVRTLSGP